MLEVDVDVEKKVVEGQCSAGAKASPRNDFLNYILEK